MFLLILMLLLVSGSARAFHIVGGEITYVDEANDFYTVTLTVYRDCLSGGAPFDTPARVGVFDGNGNFYDVFDFFDPLVTAVETTVDFPCTNISASACVEKGVYVRTINLPPNNTGYWLAYQRCCRNSTIQNLTSPDEFGATYAAFIPSVDVAAQNSSPVFNDLPPVGLCEGLPFSFDHSASDLDGDSIVYALCTPYHGASNADPAPPIPSAPPWAVVQWEAGFDAVNQIVADPIFTLDPQTGLLEGTPTQQGQYVMGVCASEYRNGVLISEIRRDFQFNVVACPSAVLASFSDIQDGVYCEGATITFDNLSANADEFQWDFGDGFTSIEASPTHTFSGSGEFEVTLISEPGAICSDTTSATYLISPNPEPLILEPTLNCPGSSYNIEVSGFIDGVVDYQWTLDSPEPFIGDGTALIESVILPEPGGLNYISVL